MASTLKFELISPEEKLISEDVAMVTIPGEEGEFGVLPGHAPLLAAVKAGIVLVSKTGINDNAPRRIFVAGGFADVGADRCTLLAEEAHDLALVDISALDAQIARLSGDAAAATGDDKARLDAKLAIAQAKREAVVGK